MRRPMRGVAGVVVNFQPHYLPELVSLPKLDKLTEE